ncbi:hypothetical protein N5079_25740 [Planotetraspora sp. A-T 1434]|nr:hypothetical protein [Planotetraspora sp. A-T 1434]MCT9933622.1 hypothetical protein [Planotetraspora sp. A-T 1434]
MAVPVEELNITYCEGWDPAGRSAVGLLSGSPPPNVIGSASSTPFS